jgi:hypothetical protein
MKTDKKQNKNGEKSTTDLPSYYDNFTVEDLDIIKEKNPAQYALIMARLKTKALETLQSKTPKKKDVMNFDDF